MHKSLNFFKTELGTAVQDLDVKVDNFFTMVMTKLEQLMGKVE